MGKAVLPPIGLIDGKVAEPSADSGGVGILCNTDDPGEWDDESWRGGREEATYMELYLFSKPPDYAHNNLVAIVSGSKRDISTLAPIGKKVTERFVEDALPDEVGVEFRNILDSKTVKYSPADLTAYRFETPTYAYSFSDAKPNFIKNIIDLIEL
jgi:hypothetical protein